MNQLKAPLFEAVVNHVKNGSVSFHVPGHKNGKIFPNIKDNPFQRILPYDLTEVPGLDDLHQPESIIKEAEKIAAEFYGVDHTFFLVNGSTAGNLAMILSVCQPGEQLIVQRNSHKSIMHGLELAGAKPVFISPTHDEHTGRHSIIDVHTVRQALDRHPEVKGIVLTYPDYFGTTYDLEKIVELAHDRHVPVLVDEAHGAHFILGKPFPKSAIQCGADCVVHSAHKTLPAMTMGSYLHFQSKFIDVQKVRYYLQMVQSSSPSYPIMASLDLARKYIANLTMEDIKGIEHNINNIRNELNKIQQFEILPIRKGIDDPIKITLQSEQINMREVEILWNNIHVYPEMVQNNQLLLIAGLQTEIDYLDIIKSMKEEIGSASFDIRDTITEKNFYSKEIYEFPYHYQQLQQVEKEWTDWKQAIGKIAAETVIPYPPGVPVLLKGERIGKEHVQIITEAIKEKQYIQYQGKDLLHGMEIYLID